MTVIAYKPIKQNSKNQSARNLVAGDRRNANEEINKNDLLPIPSNISDTNAARFGDSELNTLAAAALNGVLNIDGKWSIHEGAQKSPLKQLVEQLTIWLKDSGG